MTAQTIRPHTMAPTAQAAIHEPCHSVSVTWPCLVTGGTMPRRVKAVDLHPVVTASSTAAIPARGAHWRARRLPPGAGVTAQSAVGWPGERPAALSGLSAPSRRGALRLGLTDCLPSG